MHLVLHKRTAAPLGYAGLRILRRVGQQKMAAEVFVLEFVPRINGLMPPKLPIDAGLQGVDLAIVERKIASRRLETGSARSVAKAPPGAQSLVVHGYSNRLRGRHT